MITCDRNQPAHYLHVETGTRYPSVSQVLDVLYPDRFRWVNADVLKTAQERGNRRHRLFGVLVLWHAGLADKPEIDLRDELVMGGLMDWIVRNNVRPLRVEEPAINLRDGYAGTPDCQVLYGPKREILLVDLKSGVHEDVHAIQLQAYLRLPGYLNSQRLIDLYIDDQGQVREREVTPYVHNWAFFLNGLGVLKGRIARRIT